MNQILKWLLGADPSEMVGEGNWHFGFVSQPSQYVVLAVVLLAIPAMLLLIIRSYRREGDRPRGVKAFLAAIRIAVVLLVLVVLLRPAAVLKFTRTLYSSVVVLIDDSNSMGFTDVYADAAAKQELAAYLKIDQGELETWSRTRILREALARPGGPLTKLAKDHPIEFRVFSTQPGEDSRLLDSVLGPEQPGTEGEPAGRAGGAAAGKKADPNASGGQPAPKARPATPEAFQDILAKLRDSGYETNIAAGLRDTVRSLAGRRVAGIVIASDGRSTSADARNRLHEALAYADQQHMRLYPVLVGDPAPPKNLSVTGLQAPQEVRRGARTELTAVLAHRNLSGESVTVKLLCRAKGKTNWTDTGISQTVTLDAESPTSAPAGAIPAAEKDKGVQSVAISLEPNDIGEFVYRAAVDPRKDERNTADNYAEAPMKVSDEKVRVLLISGDAGWEFQYLRNFLTRQPDLYRVSVWQQNADPNVNQSSSTGMKLTKLPATLEELIGSPDGKPHPGYDVVILYDPRPTEEGFDGAFVANLETFVKRHGGGLCHIVSNKYSDTVLRSVGAYEPLGNMLPVEVASNTSDLVVRISQGQPEAWAVRPTSYGLDHPVTRLGPTAKESAAVWEILPGSFWSHPVMRSKPLARVLAVSANPMRRTSKSDPEPLVVTQGYGQGRVLYMGFDDTWRWRFIQDGHYHRLFWSNVVRYLATLQARHVTIAAGGDRFNVGERITIEVDAYDDKYNPLKAEQFKLDMRDVAGGRDAQSIVLEPSRDKDNRIKEGRFSATIKLVHTGTFELTVPDDYPLGRDKVQPKTIRVDLPRAEAVRSEADRAAMMGLPSRPENFLEVQQVDRLASLIPSDKKTAVREKHLEMWDSNLTLALIVLLLAIEWIVRKKHNLA